MAVALLSATLDGADATFYGRIDDPDGYTNVRAEPDGNSEVVARLTEGEKFLFEPSAESNWWKVYWDENPPELKGYVHNSRVKALPELYTRIGPDSTEYPSTVKLRERSEKLSYRLYPSNRNLYALPGGGVVSDNGLTYDADSDKWVNFFPTEMGAAGVTSVAPDGRIIANQHSTHSCFVSADRGRSWQPLPNSDSCRVFPFKDGYLYLRSMPAPADSTAKSTRGEIYQSLLVSADMGQTWNANDHPSAGFFNNIQVDHEDGAIYAGPSFLGRDERPGSDVYYQLKVSRDQGRNWNQFAVFRGTDESIAEVVKAQGHIYLNAGRDFMISGDGGRTWRTFSHETDEDFPEFVCNAVASADRLYLFDCSRVYISDLSLNKIAVHGFYTPLAHWPEMDGNYGFYTWCISKSAVTEIGEIYVSRKEGVYHSSDGGMTFRAIGRDSTMLDEPLRCVETIGDTVLTGSIFGLGISNDGGKTFRTITRTQGLAENYVDNVYGDGKGLIVGSSIQGFAYSTDGGKNFSTVFQRTYDGSPPTIFLRGRGSNALVYGSQFPPHALVQSGGKYVLKKLTLPEPFVGAGGADMDTSGHLIVVFDRYNNLRISHNGLDGDWQYVADNKYNCPIHVYNPIHITDQGAIYIACSEKIYRNTNTGNRMICSYDGGRTWLDRDFYSGGIKLHGFDADGNLYMEYSVERNQRYVSDDFGNSWKLIYSRRFR